MRNWRIVVMVLLVLSAGCTSFPGGDGETRSTLNLTVQNDRSQPVSFQLAVTDEDGAVLANESEQLASGVGQTFEFTVHTTGRHEGTVTGEDWRGQLAWNADTCARFDAAVRITDESVEVASECLEQQ